MAKKAKALPDKIPIMGVDFDISWRDAGCEDERGYFLGDQRRIGIAPHDTICHEQGASLLHEAIHGVLYASGLDEVLCGLKPELDETVTRTLEIGLYPILKLLASIPPK